MLTRVGKRVTEERNALCFSPRHEHIYTSVNQSESGSRVDEHLETLGGTLDVGDGDVIELNEVNRDGETVE